MSYFFRLFSVFLHPNPWLSQTSRSTTDPVGDIEAGVDLGPVEPERRRNMGWAKFILPSCFTAATDVTLAYVQVHSNFPTGFHFLNMAILFAFASFFLAWFINPKYMVTIKVVVNCGVFFTYTAFFIGVTIPVPLSLKITGWLVYAISLIAILFSFKTELKRNRASTPTSLTAKSSSSSATMNRSSGFFGMYE